MSYFLNINKPGGMTAHDVVNKVRRIVSIKQVGHAGTLDPMATGVLPIAVGKACRLISYLGHDKTYIAGIDFGINTTTDDVEGEVIDRREVAFDLAQLKDALSGFSGTFEQLPPFYSAVHYNGKRLYELARQGILPDDIKPRAVTVHELDLLEAKIPNVSLRIKCSAGTYIRSIARDLGEKLGCGGALSSLVRVAAGSFSLDSAISLEKLAELKTADRLEQAMILPQEVLDMPVIPLSLEQSKRLCNGQSVAIGERALVEKCSDSKLALAVNADRILALCRINRSVGDECTQLQSEQSTLSPEVVLAHGI
jgi:tRNA pseudouridine55 synthase